MVHQNLRIDLLVLLLAGLIICVATGCGSEPKTHAGEDPQAAVATEPQTDEKAFVDDFESGDTGKWQGPEESLETSDGSAGDSEPEN